MASPVAAVRQPLSTRNINTSYFTVNPPQQTTTTKQSSTTSLLSHKRSISQISAGQENVTVQSQILDVAIGKTTSPRHTRSTSLPANQRATTPTTTANKPGVPLSHTQVAAFKQPLPRIRISATARQRQKTHDPRPQEQPVQEDKEMIEWRRSTKALFQRSVFYFDGLDGHFEEQVSILLARFGSVIHTSIQG